jgi:transcriptional regulator with XRE-family HTH domain
VKKSGDATPKYVLRSMREKRGWTQEELAEKIGTTGVTVSRWESGVTSPSAFFRKKLSTVYGMSVEELGSLLKEDTNQEVEVLPRDSKQDKKLAEEALSAPAPEQQTPIFLFNEPLPNAHELYGRRHERDTLISRTFRKASTSIVGPRRSGKTWLVQYLLHVAPHELGSRFCVKYFDATMPSCSTVMGFVEEVLEEFGVPVSRSQRGLVALEKGLKSLKAKNKVPVLCIDEFEGFSNRQEFTLDFFRALRAMTQKFDLALVVVSRSPLSQVVGKDVETSGFFNIFEPCTLAPFAVQEAREFIQAKGQQANFGQLENACMWKYGEVSEQEWPPLRLQLVGKMLLAEQGKPRDDPLYWQHFEQRLERVYRGVVY